MALISLPYASLGQEPFFVGKITLVTKQKQIRKEKDVSFNMAVSKIILDFLISFSLRTIFILYSEEQEGSIQLGFVT